MQGWHLPLSCTKSLPAVALVMVTGSCFAFLPTPDFSFCGGELRLPYPQEQFLSITSSSPWANLWEKAEVSQLYASQAPCPKPSLSSPERQCSHCLTGPSILHAKGCWAKYEVSLLPASGTAEKGWLISLACKVPIHCTPALGPLRDVWG